MLRDRGDDGSGSPLLAAVGQLQFEVVLYRLQAEYGVEARLEPLDYSIARWVTDNGSSSVGGSGVKVGGGAGGDGWEAVKRADTDAKLFGVYVCKDRWDRPVLLFRNPWKVSQLTTEVDYLHLEPWAMPPTEYS